MNSAKSIVPPQHSRPVWPSWKDVADGCTGLAQRTGKRGLCRCRCVTCGRTTSACHCPCLLHIPLPMPSAHADVHDPAPASASSHDAALVPASTVPMLIDWPLPVPIRKQVKEALQKRLQDDYHVQGKIAITIFTQHGFVEVDPEESQKITGVTQDIAI